MLVQTGPAVPLILAGLLSVAPGSSSGTPPTSTAPAVAPPSPTVTPNTIGNGSRFTATPTRGATFTPLGEASTPIIGGGRSRALAETTVNPVMPPATATQIGPTG